MNSYPYYNNNYYMQELQNTRDRIDAQMKQLQQNQAQQAYQQPIQQPITQNFQISPNTINSELESRYANNIDEVKNTFVTKTGVFITKDFSNLWIKDASGNIRTFKTEEVIELDERDKEIYLLKKQIEELKGRVGNANEYADTIADEQITNEKPTRVQSNKRTNAK